MTESLSLWLDFLSKQGVPALVAAGSESTPVLPPSLLQQGFITALHDVGVLAVSGENALDFLQNQLTNDLVALDEQHAQLSGYCAANGRLLATLLLWKTKDHILILLPQTLLASIQKRLQMFVLRAKVLIEDKSSTLAIIGMGATANSPLPLPAPAAAFELSPSFDGQIIHMPDTLELSRYLWIGPHEQAPAVWSRVATLLPPCSPAAWHWTQIHAGLPQILEPTREKFVPQMVNYELIGGVNFRKGCYPGQEIVARSQYLGKLKRRMQLASAEAGMVAPGTEVFSSADPGQPCGMVVNAEIGPDGRLACLIEIKTELLGSDIHLQTLVGPRLTFGTLPYSLEATI
ncbi:MAG: folate-binding protein [Oxalobacteraceae bacterium]|jgi:folate-binding protein YgfZ|nr:folate-binding protein [Oxalobacteraceae bacterium]